MNKRYLSLALATISSVAFLSACGTSDAEDQVAASDGSVEQPTKVNTAPVVPGDVLLSSEEAPAGYTANDLDALLGEGMTEEESAEVIALLKELNKDAVTQPAECAPLVPTSMDIITQVEEDPERSAYLEYTSADESETIMVFVSTADVGQVPEDPATCATFSNMMNETQGAESINYQVEPREIELPGADTDISAHVVTTTSVLESGQTESVVVAGTVDGAYFSISADNASNEGLVDELARAQVEKISNR